MVLISSWFGGGNRNSGYLYDFASNKILTSSLWMLYHSRSGNSSWTGGLMRMHDSPIVVNDKPV